MIKRLALVATLAALGTTATHAELFGLPNGRSANPSDLSPLSVEGAFTTGGDYQNIGARVNYSVSPQLTVFGDFGLTEIGGAGPSFDGNAFGAGLFFHLGQQQFLPDYDVAAKLSYHVADLEFGGATADYSNISFEALVSSKTPISENGLKWYANAGLNILDVDFDFDGFFGAEGESDTELLIGGGVYLPAGPGEVYGGVDLIDEIVFGVGYRYFVQ